MRQVFETNHLYTIPVLLTGFENLDIWIKPEANNAPCYCFSPFQKTILQLKTISRSPVLYISVAPTHLKYAKAQLHEIDMSECVKIIIEPLERGSQNILTACALNIKQTYEDALMICIDGTHLPKNWDRLQTNYSTIIASSVSKQMIISYDHYSDKHIEKEPQKFKKEVVKRYYTERFPILYTVSNHFIPDNDNQNAMQISFTTASTLLRALNEYDKSSLEACERALLYADKIQGLIWPNLNRWALISKRDYQDFLNKASHYVLSSPFTIQSAVSYQEAMPSIAPFEGENIIRISGALLETVEKSTRELKEHSLMGEPHLPHIT